MNSMVETVPKHRIVLSFEQTQDFRKRVVVLHGNPENYEKQEKINFENEKNNEKTADLIRNWTELEKITRLVDHPHHESDSEDESIYHENGKRYHKIHHLREIPECNWAVFISFDDVGNASEAEEYSIIQTILVREE